MRNPILLLLVLTASAAPGQDDVMTVEKWKVQTGDDRAWAAPDFDDHDWPAGALPGVRAAGFRWYRTTVTVPAKWRDEPLALAFGPMGQAFEVYVEGARVGGLSVLEPVPVGVFPRHLSLDLPAGSGAAGALHVAVRRWVGRGPFNFPSLFIGGNASFGHAPQLGPAGLMRTRERLHVIEGEKSTALNRAQFGFVGLVGLLALVFFAQRPDRREYLWMGSGPVLGAMAMFSTLLALTLDLPVRSAIPSLSVLLYWCTPASANMLLGQLCPRMRWPNSVTAALYLAVGVGGALAMMADQAFNVPIFVLNIVSGAFYFVTLILIWRENRYGSALAASLLLVPFALIPAQLGLIRGRYLWNGYFVDLMDVATSFYAVATLTILWLRSRNEQREQRAREQELAAGQRVQQALLETDAAGTPGFVVEKAYLPAREVGGDFYQVIPRADGALLVVVGDVSGKGLEAAMMGARLLGALELVKQLLPGQVLTQLNEAIRGRSRGGFVTCCCALFAPDGTVTLANAGHLAPYLDGAEVETEAGLPLGLAPGAEYAETRAALGKGAITFLTDGVVEAENAQRELFGFDRTREISGQSALEIAEAARVWGQNDDITVVTVWRKV